MLFRSGSKVDSATGKQVKLDDSQFKAVAGKITVEGGTVSPQPTKPTDEPTAITTSTPGQTYNEQPVTKTEIAGALEGPTVDAGTYKVKAGETFKVKLKATNNKDGFNALNSWLDVDTDVFEIVGMEGGDIDDPENDDSLAFSNVTLNQFHKDNAPANVTTILALYSDTNNLTGDAVIATITLKVKEGTADNNYVLTFDAKGDGGAMANRVVTKDGERAPVVINPTFKGALIQVGEGAAPTATPTTVPTVKPTVDPTVTPTQTPVAGDIQIELGEIEGKPGEKVKVPVYAKNVGEGFSALQFDYDITDGLKIGRGIKGDFGCSWTIGTKGKSAQFLEADGMNITKDGCIGKLDPPDSFRLS